MHLLVLTHRPDAAALLPSVGQLDHRLQLAALAPGAIAGIGDCDVVIVDATQELQPAVDTVRTMSLHDLDRPVLVVIAEGGLAVLKVSWGFDDWVLPSVSAVELETRLRLLVDRARAAAPGRAATVGELMIDEDSYQVRLRGHPLDLTYKEFELLKALANAPNRVFTRDLLLQEVWGYDYFGGSRTVDVHVRRLRAKLGPEHEQMIVTVRGVGYKLVPPGQRTHRGPEEADGSPG